MNKEEQYKKTKEKLQSLEYVLYFMLVIFALAAIFFAGAAYGYNDGLSYCSEQLARIGDALN